MAQGSPRTTEGRQTQRQKDRRMETRLPISDRATLNGIYLDPKMLGIESEPKGKPKQLCVIEL